MIYEFKKKKELKKEHIKKPFSLIFKVYSVVMKNLKIQYLPKV